MQSVDTACPPRLLRHQPGLLEQPEVTGDSGAADGELVGDLGDRATALPQQLDNRPPVWVAKGVERVTGRIRASTQA